MNELLQDLNRKQKEAVTQTAGPSLVLAGAGSGKTRVLVYKVLYLIQVKKVDPKKIVMITFTNKAASEMKKRIHAVLGSQVALGYVGTFHSFCAMILRRDGMHIGIPHDYVIYDDGDSQTLMKQILKQLDTNYSPRFFSSRISEAKNQMVAPDEFIQTYSFHRAAQVAQVYHQYQKSLSKNKALDFDDLLMMTVLLLKTCPDVLLKYQNKYHYLLIDEFQDTNISQYLLGKFLSKKHKNITVVGDFSQSIYSWRGADIRNLQKFSEDFPDAHVVNLERNYRSTESIVRFANDVISENETHPILNLHTENESGEEVLIQEVANEEEEGRYIAEVIGEAVDMMDYSDIAILYRTNAQSRSIEEVLIHVGIPYVLIGGTRFYERKEIKDVLCYLRLLIHPDDSVALERIKKLGVRRFGKFREMYLRTKNEVGDYSTEELMEKIFASTEYLGLYDPDNAEDYARLENIKELKSVAIAFPNLAQFLEQVALVESEYFEKEKMGTSDQGVRLMTLHQAKGLEFELVIITGLEEGILPHARSVDEVKELEEERRLFYVGVTRAKKRLIITHAKNRFIFGKRTIAMKSRFIRDGSEEEIEWW